MWPWTFVRMAARTIRRVLTGDIVQRAELEMAGGRLSISWRLKRERCSGNEYVVLATNAYYYVFELEELDRFIDAANTIRASQAPGSAASLDAAPKSGRLSDVLTGEVLRRIDTTIYEGNLELSLRLTRDKATLDENVVLAATAPGWYLYYSFAWGEFHRFIAQAKKVRAASRSDNLGASPTLSPR